MLNSVRVVESAIPPVELVAVRDRLLVGVRCLRHTPALAQITAAAVAAMLVLGFYETVTFAVIAALGRPPAFFGVLMSIQGAGSIVGGFAAAPLIRRLGEARTLGVGLMAWSIASLVYTVPSAAVACTAVGIFGIAVPLYAVALATAGQRFTPPRLQGRVGAARSMLTNLSQTLSIATGAALVGAVDYRLLLLVVAAVATAAALPVLLQPSRPPSLARTQSRVATNERATS
jgi:MFS family permease